jgi:hypothetical protein
MNKRWEEVDTIQKNETERKDFGEGEDLVASSRSAEPRTHCPLQTDLAPR